MKTLLQYVAVILVVSGSLFAWLGTRQDRPTNHQNAAQPQTVEVPQAGAEHSQTTANLVEDADGREARQACSTEGCEGQDSLVESEPKVTREQWLAEAEDLQNQLIEAFQKGDSVSVEEALRSVSSAQR